MKTYSPTMPAFCRHFSLKFFAGALSVLAFSGTGFASPALVQHHYIVNLDGPSESPPNASPATGTATVDYDSSAHTMRVQINFSGLLGTTTASHIHSATVTAGTGTAGVATTTPSFAGFPLGVTSGTYDITLDMTQASSYNSAFVTANGGTTASAEAALAAGMATGNAYLNIHTTVVPGGEIRGFLTPAIPPSDPPVIGSQSGSQTNNAGTTAVFSAGVTGTAPFYYFWSKDGVLLTDNAKFSGSATYSLTVSNLLRPDAGVYLVVVSNAVANATSAPIVLGVIDPAINTQPQDASIGTGTNQIFSVSAGGTPDLHYQWFYANSTNRPAGKIRNQTNTTLNLGPVTSRMAGSYFVVITNQLSVPNTVTSRVAVLMVDAPPVIHTQPGNYSKVAGNNVTFSVKATGAADLQYQWYENGSLLGGQTSRTLSLIDVQEIGTNFYSCTVTNAYGTATSSTNLPSVHGQLVVKLDTNAPSVSITYPVRNARLTNSMIYTNGGASATAPCFILAGGVHDNGLITRVTIKQIYPVVDQGPPQQPASAKEGASAAGSLSGNSIPANLTRTAPGSVKFTNYLSLADGTNIFEVIACDSAGHSRTNIRGFFLVHPSRLTVNVNGTGSTLAVGTTNYGVATNCAMLEIGRLYTIKAVAGTNSQFANWTDRCNNTLTNGLQLKFIMTPHLVLNANFPTNPIVAAHVDGMFNGLFSETNGVGQPNVLMRSAGFVHITVKTNASFSGSATLEGHSYSFGSVFDGDGDAEVVIKRAAHGESNLVVNLHLDWVGTTKQITGTVATTDLSHPWSANLTADLAGQYSTAARYTALIAPGVTGPQGYGYGAITNDTNGVFNLVGKAADGSTISQSVPISKDGNVPLYVKLYSAKGLLTGNLSLSGGLLTGNATWLKPSGVTSVATYPEGFTNVTVVTGSTFAPPVSPALVLLNTNLTLTLSDSEGFSTNHFGAPLSWNLQLRGTNFVVVLAGSAPNLLTTAKVNGLNGILNFTYKTTAGATKSLVGIVDQSNTNGSGYLIGNTQVGSFTLQP